MTYGNATQTGRRLFALTGRTSILAGAAVAGCLWNAASASAQTAPLPPVQGFEQPSGLKLGGFDFFTRAQAGIQATDNIRLDPTEEADLKRVLALNAVARSSWEKHALAATVGYVSQQALDIRDQKSDALSGTLSGRYDFTDEVNLRVGLLSEESIIGKNDPLQFNGNLNGTTQTNTLEAALGWDDKTYFVNVLSRYQDISNDTDIDVTVVSRVQSQDREEYNLTVEAGKHYGWGKASVFGGPIRIRYSGSEIILPEDRDSEGGRAGISIQYQEGNLTGLFRAIGFAQYFNAPTIGDVISGVGTAQLSYKIDDEWGVGGVIERTFDETNIETSGGLFTNLAGIAALYKPRSDVYIKAGPTYRFYEIEGTPYEAESFTLDMAAAWQVHERVELVFNSSISNQIVNDAFLADLQYSEANATISVVVTF
ncbi:outer membrane beta-barrel protein [Nisaea acidiphila]|uniref:Outer membrane beta-barrel protein n=1 Tax=Nisaea acidiphila TaxID=1862145 RepID=A0A9J7AMS2_9PROT|nr:outer membrane beta-barrel protein [Nisaea acidiphila]UUX48462.1 outer membrane beta-barrel protein [Nisaea acidiphila]